MIVAIGFGRDLAYELGDEREALQILDGTPGPSFCKCYSGTEKLRICLFIH